MKTGVFISVTRPILKKIFNYGLATIFSKSGGATWYRLIDPRFTDSSWRRLNLPHDWAVELPLPMPTTGMWNHMDSNRSAACSGNQHRLVSPAFHRLPRPIRVCGFQLQFDGVFRNATVWVNGFHGHASQWLYRVNRRYYRCSQGLSGTT